jgi:large subunit ribosomal protein L24
MLIRRGDLVEVIAGDDRSRGGVRKIAKVLRVLRDENKIVVEGVNRVYKHVRPTQRNPRGGRLSKEMPIDVSNVLLYNPELGKGVRVGVKTNDAGDKVRVCKKTGKELGVLRRARQEKSSKSKSE